LRVVGCDGACTAIALWLPFHGDLGVLALQSLRGAKTYRFHPLAFTKAWAHGTTRSSTRAN
jgi:hypothetical protein